MDGDIVKRESTIVRYEKEIESARCTCVSCKHPGPIQAARSPPVPCAFDLWVKERADLCIMSTEVHNTMHSGKRHMLGTVYIEEEPAFVADLLISLFCM